MATAKTTKSTKRAARSRQPEVIQEQEPRIIEAVIPREYNPIGMWGYFFYELLFMIPIIGWVICVCCAFMADNHNLRNFARSQFCWIILYIITLCILAGLGLLQSFLHTIGII